MSKGSVWRRASIKEANLRWDCAFEKDPKKKAEFCKKLQEFKERQRLKEANNG